MLWHARVLPNVPPTITRKPCKASTSGPVRRGCFFLVLSQLATRSCLHFPQELGASVGKPHWSPAGSSFWGLVVGQQFPGIIEADPLGCCQQVGVTPKGPILTTSPPGSSLRALDQDV